MAAEALHYPEHMLVDVRKEQPQSKDDDVHDDAQSEMQSTTDSLPSAVSAILSSFPPSERIKALELLVMNGANNLNIINSNNNNDDNHRQHRGNHRSKKSKSKSHSSSAKPLNNLPVEDKITTANLDSVTTTDKKIVPRPDVMMSYPFVDDADVRAVLTGCSPHKVPSPTKVDTNREFVREDATTLTPTIRQSPFYTFKSREQVRRAR